MNLNTASPLNKPYPVKENDLVIVDVISTGSKGDGIAKIDGFVLVIPEAKADHRYRVLVTAIRGKVGFARIEDEVYSKRIEE